MDYMNPTFMFGSAAEDIAVGHIFIAGFAVMFGGYWLKWKLSERRKVRYDAKKEERVFREAAEEKRYRLDRREQPFDRQFGEYKITERKTVG